MRNGTLSEGGLATACVTVTRGLLGVSLPAAPLPRCYSPAHIRPPACLSMSLCASPLRSLRMTPPAAGQQNVVADVVPVDVGLLPRCGCHTTGCSIRSRHTAHAHARGPFWGPVHQPLHLRLSAGAVDIAVILIGHGHPLLAKPPQEPAVCLGPHMPTARAGRLTDSPTAPATAAIYSSHSQYTWGTGTGTPGDLRAKACGADPDVNKNRDLVYFHRQAGHF